MVFDQLMILYSGDPPLEVVNRYGHGECVKEMVLKYVRKHMADREKVDCNEAAQQHWYHIDDTQVASDQMR